MGKKKRKAGRPDKSQEQPKKRIPARSAGGKWLLLAVLVLATLAAYYPAWHGGMLWDDARHITSNDLRSPVGLWRIWFDFGATQQYYPVTHSAFWFLYHLWGDDTLGYHVVNIILHALSAFLAALILRRLQIPGAWLAAAIFALHPVQVESVAWMSELKNTLSGCFYLSAFLSYLHFDKDRQRRYYAAALVLFLLALLSKTVTSSLPAALLVVFWWQRGRLNWRRDVFPLAPFFALGAGAGLVTAWVERSLLGAQGTPYLLTPIERGLIAGRVIWFYLGKLFWPSNLIFIYPRWQINQSLWWQYLYPVAIIALLLASWLVRKRSRAPLAALLFFCGTLFPALGFINVFPFRYSFVADHFQYLASLGVIALVSAGLAVFIRRWQLPLKRVATVCVFVFVGPLALLTWNQSRQYANDETLYRTTISRNPSCWMALNNLGLTLQASGRLDEAVARYQEALRLDPNFAEVHCNLGNALQGLGRSKEAVAEFKRALQLKPDFVEALSNLGFTLQELGRLQEAVTQYQAALRLRPNFALGHNNLGWALHSMGRLEEAIAQYKEALRLQPDFALARANLSSAQAALKQKRVP